MFENAVIWNCDSVESIDKEVDYKDEVEYAKKYYKDVPDPVPFTEEGLRQLIAECEADTSKCDYGGVSPTMGIDKNGVIVFYKLCVDTYA